MDTLWSTRRQDYMFVSYLDVNKACVCREISKIILLYATEAWPFSHCSTRFVGHWNSKMYLHGIIPEVRLTAAISCISSYVYMHRNPTWAEGFMEARNFWMLVHAN